jgi:RimJ/RimL family protein N-acetyltransferase
MRDRAAEVAIRPWSEGDLWLLQRLLGDPLMTEHIGGPETPDAIRARHERYLASDPSTCGLFAMVVESEVEPVGWVGYWESTWHDEAVWECGWHVLPEWQGRGVATAATALALERAQEQGTHHHIHAFPSVDNAASNALCRTLGFVLLGEADVEYPLGSVMHSNDWRLDLGAMAGTDLKCSDLGRPSM